MGERFLSSWAGSTAPARRTWRSFVSRASTLEEAGGSSPCCFWARFRSWPIGLWGPRSHYHRQSQSRWLEEGLKGAITPRDVTVVDVAVIVDVDVIAHVRRPTRKTSTSTTTSTSTEINPGNGRAFSIHTARGQRRGLTVRGRGNLRDLAPVVRAIFR